MSLGDRLDALERAEHVPLVATFPEESAERAPDLGEEVVAEIERLGDVCTTVNRLEFVTPGVDRPISHDDGDHVQGHGSAHPPTLGGWRQATRVESGQGTPAMSNDQVTSGRPGCWMVAV